VILSIKKKEARCDRVQSPVQSRLYPERPTPHPQILTGAHNIPLDLPPPPGTMDQSSVAIATGNGPVREIKEWQAVMDYLRALPIKNGSELPTIPVDERANEVRAIKVG
jgi:hypothetical protein